jgi:superfamily II DNA helicase RecQ
MLNFPPLSANFERDGVNLVISPNLSLIENQVRYLNKLNIRAKTINSKVNYYDRDDILDDIEGDGQTKFLFITPEMADTERFVDLIPKWLEDGTVTRVVVDEAHCLIDKCFRKSFPKLKEIRKKFPNVQFIALTTAKPETIKEIEEALAMVNPTRIIDSSVKKNIFYEVVEISENRSAEDIDFLEFFKTISPDFDALKAKEMISGIIYCQKNDEVEKIVDKLRSLNVPVRKFYASYNDRFNDYDDWMSDKIPIMVATTESFGLGIVKRFVKFVVHVGMPKDLRGFYQVSWTHTVKA